MSHPKTCNSEKGLSNQGLNPFSPQQVKEQVTVCTALESMAKSIAELQDAVDELYGKCTSVMAAAVPEVERQRDDELAGSSAVLNAIVDRTNAVNNVRDQLRRMTRRIEL